MKNKFLFLTKDSLKNKIKTKAFLTVNILLCVLLVCLVNLDSLIKLFGGDFNKPINIYVVDEANVYDEVEYQEILGFGGSFTEATTLNLSRITPELRKKVLELYFDKENCYQNAVQTEAAYILKQRIDDIVKSDFHDLITRIEVRDITGNR